MSQFPNYPLRPLPPDDLPARRTRGPIPVQPRQRPVTAQSSRDDRLREQGIDPAELRESIARRVDTFGEDQFRGMVYRIGMLRRQGRTDEADRLADQVRSQRNDPNRKAEMRQLGRDLLLVRGTVGDLPAEQQRANAIANERSMNRSLNIAAAEATNDINRRERIVMARKAAMGRAGNELAMDGRTFANDAEAAQFFDAMGSDVQQRVTRGVPQGDPGLMDARARAINLQDAAAEGITLDRTPRAQRELDPTRIAQIRAEQEIARRRQTQNNAAQNAIIDIEEDQMTADVNRNEGEARATDSAGEVGVLRSNTARTNAMLNDEIARVALEQNPTSERLKQQKAQAEAELAAAEARVKTDLAGLDSDVLRTNRDSALAVRRAEMLGNGSAGTTDIAQTGLGSEAQKLAVDSVVDRLSPMLTSTGSAGVRTTDKVVEDLTLVEQTIARTLLELPTPEQQAAYARTIMAQLESFGSLSDLRFTNSKMDIAKKSLVGNVTGDGLYGLSPTEKVVNARATLGRILFRLRSVSGESQVASAE